MHSPFSFPVLFFLSPPLSQESVSRGPYHLTVFVASPVSRWITTLTRASGTAALRYIRTAQPPTSFRLLLDFFFVLFLFARFGFGKKTARIQSEVHLFPIFLKKLPFFGICPLWFWYFIMAIGKALICCYLVFASILVGKSIFCFLSLCLFFFIFVDCLFCDTASGVCIFLESIVNS